jgi:ribonuclease P/MRP protein subunit POP3
MLLTEKRCRSLSLALFGGFRPDISTVHVDVILHTLLQLLQSSSVSERYFKRENESTPKSSSKKTKEKNKRKRTRMALATLKQHGVMLQSPPSISTAREIIPPEMKQEASEKPFLCGLNSVTRHLESMIKEKVGHSKDASAGTATTRHAPSIVFVCQVDVDPATLVSHLPLLVATYNAVCDQGCYLIKLPKGSEQQLSEAIKLRRCSVTSLDWSNAQTSLDGETKEIMTSLLAKVVEANVKVMRLDWMDKAVGSIIGNPAPISLIDPHIKHLRSSAPLDLNAVKASKRVKRTEKKVSRKKRKAERVDHIEKQVSQNKKRKRSA